MAEKKAPKKIKGMNEWAAITRKRVADAKGKAKVKAPGKIVAKKDTVETKRKTTFTKATSTPPKLKLGDYTKGGRKVAQTKSAGYGGSVAQAKGPEKAERDTSTVGKAKAKKKMSSPTRKPKKDEFSFQKAINKGFGRVY